MGTQQHSFPGMSIMPIGGGQMSPRVIIEMLPYNVLLDIFDFCRAAAMRDLEVWAWHRLVHVCRKWRYLVFGSPTRLKLRLHCTWRTPVEETLGVWPPLPIVIQHWDYPNVGDNIVVALGYRNRVCSIDIKSIGSLLLNRLATVMQEPYPALTYLHLGSIPKTTLVLPNAFLGGFAPNLQTLSLDEIRFPGLPNLLVSSTNLRYLHLERIPNTGYISPEAMVTGLSALTGLRSMTLKFKSPTSRPNRRSRHPPPLTRIVLPALTRFLFQGVSEYLEDLVARIHGPRLKYVNIRLFNQVVFEIPQLVQFIRRSELFNALDQADVTFGSHDVSVKFYWPERTTDFRELSLQVPCRELDWQVSALAQLCRQLLPLGVGQLTICERLRPIWQGDMDNTQWLELFYPFIAMRSLRISYGMWPLIVPALQQLTREFSTEVLPSLTIFT
ncbi:hypothetical protein BJV78DRAFT_427974 [Lactifluus subvellereus]|nr:hypothetical protein BJV78DRAFT_427974 [Lactifluus subvellereus]